MHTPRGRRALLTIRVIYAIHDLHLKVSKEKKGKVVDARCRDLTNAAAVNKAKAEPGSVEVCNFHEVGISFITFHLAVIHGRVGRT